MARNSAYVIGCIVVFGIWFYLGTVPPVEKRIDYSNKVISDLKKNGFKDVKILSNIVDFSYPYTFIKNVPSGVSGNLLIDKFSNKNGQLILTKLYYVQKVPALYESFYPQKPNIFIFTGNCSTMKFSIMDEQLYNNFLKSNTVNLYGELLPKTYEQLLKESNVLISIMNFHIPLKDKNDYVKSKEVHLFKRAAEIIC